MPNIGLHHLCALEINAEELVRIAGRNGFVTVSTFTQGLTGGQSQFPLIDESNKKAFAAALSHSGVSLLNIECFMLTPHTQVKDYTPALALGAELNAVGATVLIYDTDSQRVVDNLAQLCSLGQELGLRINVEFMALTPAFNTLDQMLALLNRVAADNLGLGLDILHLVRTGTQPQQLGKIPREKIHYVQVCDSKSLAVTNDYAREAGSHRLAPGDGNIEINRYLSVIPAGVAMELEVPQPASTPAADRIAYLAKKALHIGA